MDEYLIKKLREFPAANHVSASNCTFAANNFTMANNENQGQQNQINIELSEETADGTYSNLAIITHSNQEFVLDFIKVMPGVPKAKVKSRIILTPQHAKRFLKALSENVRKFESQYGEITEADPINIPPMNFGAPTAQA